MNKCSLWETLFGEVRGSERLYHWWALGIFLLGVFFLFLFEPPPDTVTFRCDRGTGICSVEKSGFFRTKTQQVKLGDIGYAHFDKFGWIIRGYPGPEIKLQDGNDISIGSGSSEQQTVEEVNTFLRKTEIKELSMTHRSFPTVIIAAFLLVGGLVSIYKAIKPYIISGIRNK